MPLTKQERIDAGAANRATIMDRIANSNYTTDIIPRKIFKGISKTNIKLFVVNEGSSCYYRIGDGLLIVSVEQAIK